MLGTERQSARMLKIKNSRLDLYGAEPSKQQQFGTAGVGGVNTGLMLQFVTIYIHGSELRIN